MTPAEVLRDVPEVADDQSSTRIEMISTSSDDLAWSLVGHGVAARCRPTIACPSGELVDSTS